MRLYPNPRYLLHGFLALGFEVALYPAARCLCAAHLAIDQPRAADLEQSDAWYMVSVPQDHHPSISTSAPGGATARPGTGEVELTGYAPNVLIRAVEVMAAALNDPRA